MRRRVRLHQLRVGMYVEALEEGEQRDGPVRSRFLIQKPEEVLELMRLNVMSAIIDVSKGCDIDDRPPGPRAAGRRAFEKQLLAEFSVEEIERARATIAGTAPHVRQLLVCARTNNAVDLDAAGIAVGQIMTATVDNAGALISLSRLKEIDEGTFLHSLAVSALMVGFGRALGEDEDTVLALGIGGLVHDLGKLAIPLDVLRKNGKLTRSEFAIVQSHPERGHAMLRQVEGVPPMALDVCLAHHERYDGSGYPRGLAGEDIPYAGRIAAICDVYDALTTVRPYKKAWTQAEAIERMLLARGHFDMALLKIFVSRMVIRGQIG